MKITLEITKAEDGGTILMFENETAKRALTFVIPDDGSRVYFMAFAMKNYHLAGLIENNVGRINLFDWLDNEVDEPLVSGLIVPPRRGEAAIMHG